MIPENYIQEWRETAPWSEPSMVEQDLIICRALVCIFKDEYLRSNLAFRGGTALHKLYLQPQVRYSEDIDLVQIHSGPIKPILERLGEVLSWLPDKVTKQKRYNNTLLFRIESETPPVQQMRLKVEINCYEHFSVLGFREIPFEVKSGWFEGSCNLTTYHLDELIGTKLRALYQRKKGRDLFDLGTALKSGQLDLDKVFQCYLKYMSFTAGSAPTFKQYKQNLDLKMEDDEFLDDMKPLLRTDAQNFNPFEAYSLVGKSLVEKMRPIKGVQKTEESASLSKRRH